MFSVEGEEAVGLREGFGQGVRSEHHGVRAGLEPQGEVSVPVNVIRLPQAPSLAELAELGVARVSWGPFLYRDAMARFEEQLTSLRE